MLEKLIMRFSDSMLFKLETVFIKIDSKIDFIKYVMDSIVLSINLIPLIKHFIARKYILVVPI